MTTTKYPKEIFSVVRKTKTLSVTSLLIAADAYNDEKPLEIYGKFSRFPVTIINTQTHPKNILTANIDISYIPDMLFRTKIAYQKELENSLITSPSVQTSQQGVSTPGTTTVLSMGTYKGMTPVQVILREGNTAGIERQRDFLAQNAARYPANQVQINAINDAINLYMTGQLNNMNIQDTGTSNSTGQRLALYSADMRPNIYKKRQDGMSLVTAFHINWVFGNKYPVDLAISTYYAPVQRLQDGRLNVVVNGMDKSSGKKENILLSSAEWMDLCARMHRNMKQFEMVSAKKLLEAAETISKQNRENARNQAYQNPVTYTPDQNTNTVPSEILNSGMNSGYYAPQPDYSGFNPMQNGFGYQ